MEDLIFLVYAVLEFYFTAVNIVFILRKGTFKQQFMKYRAITFFMPFFVSIAINILMLIYGIYMVVE